MAILPILFSLFSLSLASPRTLTIPLIPTLNPPSSADPFDTMAILASKSLSRAHHLRRSTNPIYPKVSIPLNPRSYGGYSLTLSFGTPTQSFSLIMDTGSSLVWLPCTSRYLCITCSEQPPLLFIPKNSSSAKIISCRSPKCRWLDTTVTPSDCPRGSSPRACSPYSIDYGLGSTTGILVSDTVSFSNLTKFPNFLAGCSLLSIGLPEGIAGFGRSKTSLPSQLGVNKFAYCLVSHRYDDDPSATSSLILSGDGRLPGMHYTPFRKNPEASNPTLKEFYYVNLRKIFIGGTTIKIPRRFSTPGEDGNGGTIIDTGSTFTFIEKPLFDIVVDEFRRQMVNSTVDKDAESQTGLQPCFRADGWPQTVPEMVLWFKGGARMDLPISGYFPLIGEEAACLIFTTGSAGSGVGPSMILGNYQQMNFYMEYDMKKEKLGFKRHDCMSYR